MYNPDNNLKKRFRNQIIVPFLFSLVIVVSGYLIVHPETKKLLVKDRKQSVKQMVSAVYNMINGYNDRVINKELTLEQAQKIVIENIKLLRYGENNLNYFWLQDYSGNLIFHPSLEPDIKVNISVSESIHGVALKVSQLVKSQNEGFITYTWYPLEGMSHSSIKEAYVKGYNQWGWIVATGFMVNDIETDLQRLTKEVLIILGILMFCLILLLILILFRNYKNLKEIMLSDLELKKSEGRFRGFIDHIDNGLLILENEIPVFINNQFNEIFERTHSKDVKFEIANFLPSSEKERVSLLLNSMTELSNLEFTTWIVLENKKEKFINFHFISTHVGEIVIRYLIVQDLTEQKQTFNTIDILSENIVQSKDSVVITDLNGRIEYVNPGFEKVTGYSSEEVIGLNPKFLKSGKMHPSVYKNLWKTITKGEIWRGEILNSKKDGSLFWESTIIFPIKNRQNEIIKYSSIKTDITHQKRMEQELFKAKNKAEENDRLKTALLNNVSHEVRTPLNAIFGFVQIIKNQIESEKIDEYLKIISQNCKILLQLFDNIIDVSSIESGSISIHKEDVRLKELLLKLVTKFNTQITALDKKAVEIVVELDNNFDQLVLFTDRTRIGQIFEELLSNAVKFTNEGQITISYSIDYEYITFYISDTGVGIAEQEREYIFKTFSHGENMYVSLHKGVGLGLNIAHLLSQMLGGNLTFESKVGVGTTFAVSFSTIELKNYNLGTENISNSKYKVKGKIVLIAEDNDENFAYFETLLMPDNNVIRAKTGVEAINIIEKSTEVPDIIIMDIFMPEMDGISAAQIIRGIKPNIPIIAISAISMEIQESEQKAFDHFLTKPVSYKHLMKKIQELISLKSSLN